MFLLQNTLLAKDCFEELKEQSQKKAPEYAQLFEIYTHDDFFLLKLSNQSWILNRNPSRKQVTKCLKEGSLRETQVFDLPLDFFAAISATSLQVFEYLGVLQNLKAFSNPTLTYSEKLLSLFKSKDLIDISYPIKIERILASKVDLVFAYALSAFELAVFKGLDEIAQGEVKTVFIEEFLESTPLARAEWIKVYSLFFDKLDLGISFFEEIKSRYLDLKEHIRRNSTEESIVLVGAQEFLDFQTINSHHILSSLLKDVHATLFFTDDERASFEKVLLRKGDFFWLPQNHYRGKSDIEKYPHYSLLSREKVHIFTITKRINGWGANDYWETAFLRPDLLLRDLYLVFENDKEKTKGILKKVFANNRDEIKNFDLSSSETLWYQEIFL